jgi:hypothetical protein
MKLIFKTLFFVVCITFFSCTKKRECKNIPKISGDIIELLNLYEYKCNSYYTHLEFAKKNYSQTKGQYFFS